MRIMIIIGILVLTACNSGVKGKNGVTYKNATEYNEYIMENQKDVVNVILDFGKAINLDLDSADRILDKGAKITQEALNNIKGMPVFKGDSAFRNAAIHSFEFYKEIISNQYKQIISIRRKGESRTEEDVAFLRALPAVVGKREERFDRDFHNSQKAFAQKNHLTLVKNEIQEKVDAADGKK